MFGESTGPRVEGAVSALPGAAHAGDGWYQLQQLLRDCTLVASMASRPTVITFDPTGGAPRMLVPVTITSSSFIALRGVLGRASSVAHPLRAC